MKTTTFQKLLSHDLFMRIKLEDITFRWLFKWQCSNDHELSWQYGVTQISIGLMNWNPTLQQQHTFTLKTIIVGLIPRPPPSSFLLIPSHSAHNLIDFNIYYKLRISHHMIIRKCNCNYNENDYQWMTECKYRICVGISIVQCASRINANYTWHKLKFL